MQVRAEVVFSRPLVGRLDLRDVDTTGDARTMRIPWVIAIALCTACAGASASVEHADDSSQTSTETRTDARDESTHRDSRDDSADRAHDDSTPIDVTADSASDVAPHHDACATLTPADCAAAGCVLDVGPTCRAPADDCETVVPDPQWDGTPLFTNGDPCERVRASCAWSPALNRCVPFAVVRECPADLMRASVASVACHHSEQPALSCAYPSALCACARSPLCGGARPPPDVEHAPAQFVCTPHVDERGCPSRPPRVGARCNVAEGEMCLLGCHDAYTCERRRWRRHQLPPRP